ncbi:hypothetical protein GCM10022217_13510 [Chryseobacterium ginsenosidimutans]
MAKDKKENPELPKSKEINDPKTISEKSGGHGGKANPNETAKGGTRGG